MKSFYQNKFKKFKEIKESILHLGMFAKVRVLPDLNSIQDNLEKLNLKKSISISQNQNLHQKTPWMNIKA